MAALVASLRDDSMVAGFRRPRTCSYRKRRFPSFSSAASCVQDICTPLDLSTPRRLQNGKNVASESRLPVKEVFHNHKGWLNASVDALTCTVERDSSVKASDTILHIGERSGEICLERGNKNHTGTARIIQQGSSNFQWPDRSEFEKNLTGIGKKSTRDGDVFVKSFSRGDKKHLKFVEDEPMEKLEKTSNECSDSRNKDNCSKRLIQKQKDDQTFKDSSKSYHHLKHSNQRGRGDCLCKDLNRTFKSLTDRRDKSSNKFHSMDSNCQKFESLSDEKERDWKFVVGQHIKGEVEKCKGFAGARSGSSQNFNNIAQRGLINYGKFSDYRSLATKRLLSDQEVFPGRHIGAKFKVKGVVVPDSLLSEALSHPETAKCTETGRLPVLNEAGSTIQNKKLGMSVPVVAKSTRRRQRLILLENSDDEDNAPLKPEDQVAGLCTEATMSISGLNMENNNRTEKYIAERSSLLSSQTASKSHDEEKPSHVVGKSSRVPQKRVPGHYAGDVTELNERIVERSEQESDVQYKVEGDVRKKEFADDGTCNGIVLKRTTGKRKQRKRAKLDGHLVNAKKESPLTERQRALQFNKEHGDATLGASFVEFPEGLTHCFRKKKKDALTEAEMQLKKEEAAERRRQQAEKNSKEIQENTIHKILSQDSQRKKREDKLQKQREELEKEKKAAGRAVPLNTVRCIMGPSGTTVSFSQDIDLSKIFSPPCSYPKEREKCAEPSCNNAYKYRDSKSSLPLCSLQCYKAVQNLT